MEVLAKLFTLSHKKSANNSNELPVVELRPRAESNGSEISHDSGAFFRESRVDQVVSQEDEIQRKRLSPTIIRRTLDCWNPETCIRLLRMPSVQNYSGLRKLISESDKAWIVQFLEMGGLEVLLECVDRLSSKKSLHGRMESTLLLLQCVNCLKIVVNSHHALEFIVQQRSYSKRLSEVLCSKNTLVRKQLFDLMSTLCIFSQEGHNLTLDILECYRVSQNQRYRFSVLLAEIKQAEVLPHVATVLGLINFIIVGASGFRLRTRIRNEFLALDLLDLMDSLKLFSDEDIQFQCLVFRKSQMADEEHARSLGIKSSFSHYAYFQALLDKVEDTPISGSLLIVLQNLSQLDPHSPKTDYLWSLLEDITENAVTGTESTARSWILNECRRIYMRSTGTQTCIQIPQTFAIEDSVRRQQTAQRYEDDEESSVKSFDSRDSGVPVSRNQSFASSCPRSPRNTLHSQCCSEPDIPSLKAENNENYFHKKRSGSFFRTIGMSLSLTRSSTRKTGSNLVKGKTNIMASHESLESVPMSLRSESPIPQSDILLEESSKVRSSMSFPFFYRSKKYHLLKSAPKVMIHPPSPNVTGNIKPTLSAASSRDGMTSMDVKRSRKQNQHSYSLAHEDSFTSQLSDHIAPEYSDTNTIASEIDESNLNYQDKNISKRTLSIDESKRSYCEENVGHLSKSTPDLVKDASSPSPPPPPPPPPPPLPSISSQHLGVNVRPITKPSLDLSQSKGNRSSWSGGSSEKEFEDLNLKTVYNTLPKPKSKMKTLNWAKIPSAHVSVQSIWSEIDQESKTMDLNFEEMEKLFCQESSPAQSLMITKKKPAKSVVSLLDSKRSLSIGIFLKQFKGGSDEILDIVRQCKHKDIGAERLRTLLRLLPDDNEIQALSSYKGDMSSLGTAEKFILRLNAIDAYDCRIEGMLLLSEFPTTIETLQESTQHFLGACSELLVNKGFKNFLKLILVTGNFMNAGSYAGNAAGFRLSTLPKLMDTRANQPRITLLHYLVKEAQRKDKDSLKFTNELLEKLSHCSRLTLENIISEISQLEKSLERLNYRMKRDCGQLNRHFGAFIQNGIKQVNTVKRKTEEIKKLSTELANRFCEDEKKFQLEECLNTVYIFCAKIKMIESENKVWRKVDV